MIEKFKLLKNYPNPFNHSTKTKWQLPKRIRQVIKVFDLFGSEIKTFVDEILEFGVHERTFDASTVTSGVDFYQLHAENFIQSKKMITLK